jgi:hypothetical protein
MPAKPWQKQAWIIYQMDERINVWMSGLFDF